MIVLHTLGKSAIEAGSLRLTSTSPRKFALLLYLAIERGRRVPRDTLREMVFADQTEKNAQHSVRELIYQFRNAGVSIVSDKLTVEIAADDVRTDFDDFVTRQPSTREHIDAVTRGFLPGYAPDHSRTFSEWVEALRSRVSRDLCRALSREINRSRRAGDWSMAEHAAHACLTLDPLHEEATFAIAEALAISGAKAQAVDLLDQYSNEVGGARGDLRLSASVLRRRISERVRDTYRPPLTLSFVGRDREMTILSERYDRVLFAESQCIVIAGDPGIGKSRLAEEFCMRATLRGARVEQIATQPHDVHRPMGSFADLVPRLLQLPGALGCSPASMAALKRLTTHEPGDGANETAGQHSEAVQAAIARAITDLVDAIASEAPLVVLIDDIQWADELSRRMIATLTSPRQSRRLMVLLTSRDRDVIQFFAQRSERALGLALPPLAPASSQEVLTRALAEQHQELDEELRSWIAYTSGGNPFFLRCLIAHFQSTGERFVVPTSISSLLDQQLAALRGEAAAVLGMCVALGRHAELDRLVRALELPYIQLQLAIRELESSHLITHQGQRIEPAHWLVAEAVARAGTPISFQLMHRRVAMILEREGADENATFLLWDCAEHWLLANDKTAAANVMRSCANKAIAIGQSREAAETLLRAVTIIDGEERVRLITAAMQIADASGESDVILRGAQLAKDLCIQVDYDGFPIAEILAHLSQLVSDPALTGALLRWLEADKPVHHRLKAGVGALILADLEGDPELAAMAYTKLQQELSAPALSSEVPVLQFLLLYHSMFGDRDESERIAKKLLALAPTLEPGMAADAQRKSAIALWKAGSVEIALEAFQSAYRNAVGAGLLRLQHALASAMAGSYFDLGNESASAHWLLTAEAVVTEVPDLAFAPTHFTLRVDVACTRGDPAEARRAMPTGLHASGMAGASRLSRWVRAQNARIQQLEGDSSDPDAVVRTCTQHHRKNGETGDVSDVEIATAVHALLAAHRGSEASALIRNYVSTYRRSHSPLNRNLVVAAKLAGSSVGSIKCGE